MSKPEQEPFKTAALSLLGACICIGAAVFLLSVLSEVMLIDCEPGEYAPLYTKPNHYCAEWEAGDE